MYQIIGKAYLNPTVVKMDILAPWVARKGLPGQFVMVRVHEKGERIPLTLADYDREKGIITLIFQIVGKTTMLMAQKEEGEYLADVVGPLGVPTPLNGLSKVAVVGGGVGCAIAYPQAKALFQNGAKVHLIAGFRSKEHMILEEEMKAVSEQCIIMTEDGSYGQTGRVTDGLQALLESGETYDAVIAIGPLIMMKFVSQLTKKYGIKTIVSMNTIMIDGTGMCGCCRVTVGGETKFACVDGPDFDGHLVDFDEAMRRSVIYKKQEAEQAHQCRLEGMLNGR